MNAGPNADVVVVGGGIVGVCTALHLQRGGRRVMLIERGIAGDEASGHNGGMFSGDCIPTAMPGVIRSLPTLLTDPDSALVLRWRYVPRLTPWLLRFALNSRPSRVEQMSAALGSLTMRGIEAFRPLITGTELEGTLDNRGYLYGYVHKETRDHESYSFELRKRRGIAYEFLDADGVARMSPSLGGLFEAGAYFPNAFYTEDPRAFTQSLLDQFIAKGGVAQRDEVVGFSTSAGRIEQVRMKGGAVSAGAVVIAAGPWSRGLLRQLGTDVPLDVERGYGIDLPNPGLKLDLPIVIADYHVPITPFRGGLRLVGIDELSSISAPADLSVADRLLRGALKVFPNLRTEGAVRWMRRRPSLPDSLPVIGRAPRVANAFLAFGHGHKGLGTGAITGKLIQEIMDGQPTTIDVAPFSPTRFALWGRPPQQPRPLTGTTR